MIEIIRARVQAYHSATHTADVRPVVGPAAVMAGLPVIEACNTLLIAADDVVAVLIWSDVGGLVLGPYGNVPAAGDAAPHAASHQNGAGDEINVGALSGELADDQPPKAHAVAHQNAGGDEVNVAGLSGELADDQPPKTHALGGGGHSADTLANLNTKVSDATLDDSSATRTPSAHAVAHQNAGGDEVNVGGLSGELADDQPPKDHAVAHQNTGGDEISVADLSGELADDQPPKEHDLGGAAHAADTLADLNLKVSDATLDDVGDTRTPAAHTLDSHAASRVGKDRLEWTAGKLLRGAGVGSDPVEIEVPAGWSGPSVRVYRSDNQAVATSTWASVVFDTERWDDPGDDQWEGVTNPSRLTCVEAGSYVISFSLWWEANVTGHRIVGIRLNGATSIAYETEHGGLALDLVRHTVTTVYKLAVDDFVEVRVWQNSGGNLNVQAQPNQSPELMMVKVAS